MRACLLLIALALTGCADDPSPPTPEVHRHRISDDERCQNFGATPGTDAYVHCRTTLYAQRKAAVDNEIAAAIAADPSLH
jgi:hypothetical protein